MKLNSTNCSMLLCSLALAATPPVAALTAATILEDFNLSLIGGQAREEFERAQGEIDRAHQAVQLAQAALADTFADLEVPEPPEPPELPEPPAQYGWNVMPDFDAIVNGAMTHVQTALGSPFAGGAGTPMIIAADLDAARQGQFQEDMSVMSRIFVKAANKAAGGAKGRTAMGIRLQLPFGQTGPSSLYLEDFGAVFFLNVNYPLVAPPAKSEPKLEPEKPTDTAWQEARAELYGAPQGRRSTGVAVVVPPAGSQLEYDAGRVEALKAALLEAAKNASNIRHLKPGEHIVLAVQGTGQSTAKRTDVRSGDRHGSHTSGATKSSTDTTLLSIRFKKADADAAAQGKLSAEEFGKKAALWAR